MVLLECSEMCGLMVALLYLLGVVVAVVCAVVLVVLIGGLVVVPLAHRALTRLGWARTDEERWDMEEERDES